MRKDQVWASARNAAFGNRHGNQKVAKVMKEFDDLEKGLGDAPVYVPGVVLRRRGSKVVRLVG